MSYFGDWFEGRAKKPKLADLEKEVVEGIDRYDRQDYARIYEQMKDFRLGQRELADFADTGKELWGDGFFELLKADPQLKDQGRILPSFLINHRVASEMTGLPEYERLRTWTKGDVVSSAVGMCSIKDDVVTLFDRAKQDQKDAGDVERQMEEYEAAEDGVRDMDEMIEAWKNAQDDPSDPDFSEQAENMDDAMDQAREALKKMLGQLEADMDKLEGNIKGKVAGVIPGIRKAMDETSDEAEELAIAAASWGVDPGELRKMDFKQRAKLAERLLGNERLKRLTDMIGAMERMAIDAQTHLVYYLPQEVYDVELGDDIGHLLPQELLYLTDETLELDFFQRYTEQKLLQYAMRGQEQLAKGGIIFCMDNSASMDGEPEVWAKSFGLAMLAIADMQKRTFYGIHFASRHEIKCFDFRTPAALTLAAKLEYAEHFFCGGTDFETPLKKALSILQDEFKENGAVKGDIVFCTDGQARVTDAFMKNFKAEQERIGFNVYGIMIGGNRTAEPLWTICDEKVVTVSDLLSGTEVKGLFEAM